MTLTPVQARDQAVAELDLTTVGMINAKWKTPPAGTHWANAKALLAQIGVPVPTPPPDPAGWAIAAPGSTGVRVENLTNPTGPAINAHSPTDPTSYTDKIITAGGDSAILINGVDGRTLTRIQCLDVARGNAQSYGKHALYDKGKNTYVSDFYATGSPFAASGFSVRYAGFNADRFDLDGFQIGISYYEESAVKGTCLFENGHVVYTNTGAWLSLDAGKRVTPDFVFDNVLFTGPKLVVACQAGLLDGSVTFRNGCMWRLHPTDGFVPVTADMCQNIPSAKLHISA